MNVPIGRLGSFKPERARRIASETVLTASSWPIKRLWRTSSIEINFFISLSTNLETGTPVHLLTTSAMSSPSISSLSNWLSFLSVPWMSSSFFCNSINLPYFNSAAFCKSVLRSAFSISSLTCSISSLIDASPWIVAFSLFHCSFKTLILDSKSLISCEISKIFLSQSGFVSSFFKASRSISNWTFCLDIISISSGIESISIRRDDAASSIKSMALSGKKRSVMYLSDNFAAWIKALSRILTPWWTSYFSFKPRKILIVSSTEGSSTITGWKRLSKAGSFSIYFLYSLIVVAPIVLSTPLANIGFNKLPASIEPSVAPAPTTVWSSSINITICPSDSSTSFKTAFKRSSNSPRNFAPATKAPKSNEINLSFFKLSGTSPLTIRWAKPSMIAVLPTPGSPIRTGLFFVRLFKTCIIRRISSSRPITGSNLPFLASSVRSVEYFSNAFIFSSAFLLSTFLLPLIFFIAFNTVFDVTLLSASIFLMLLFSSRVIARRISSIEIKSSFNSLDASSAKSSNATVLFDINNCCVFWTPLTVGKSVIAFVTALIKFWFRSFNSVR